MPPITNSIVFANSDYDQLFFYSFFEKIGLPYHFDIGIDLYMFAYPFLAPVSIRKQFDFNNSTIEGITFGASYGIFTIEQFMLFSSIITPHINFTVGIAKQAMPYNEFTFWDVVYQRVEYDNYFAQSTFDINFKNLDIMPYIVFNYNFIQPDIDGIFNLRTFLNDDNNDSYYTISLGIIFYIEISFKDLKLKSKTHAKQD